MATWNRFEDMEVWQKARVLSARIHGMTMQGACSKDFAFVRQIRSAAVSIMSNIAEGFERDGNREFIQFLSIAKGSTGEVRSQLYSALDVGYSSPENFEELYLMTVEIGRMLSGLMKYLQQVDMKGRKFQ
ncbi:four helix bundle protein [Zavarzinella formosa]|uniref:four helix bundle protein n=1 Tax=Zavarzinella formosa TaxID=360055 RepID=UPI0002DDC339|nr:four helix bundle protein [Zavarzinella formosa]